MAEGEKKYLSVLDDDGASHEVSSNRSTITVFAR